MSKNPNKSQMDRRDERNTARLGIISMQSRVDTSVTKWDAEWQIDGRPYRIQCFAPKGRPHGVDTDVVLAIQTLYVRAGCPVHGWVHTTAYELREMSGMAQNGLNYHRLKDSLLRLATTSFLVSEGWHDHIGRRKWDTDTMRYIDRIKYREFDVQSDLPGLDETASLSIKLGDQLAESIRAGYTQALDSQLLLQLEQPPARALCRLLESYRMQPDGSRLMQLSVQLEDWRQACGIVSDRSEIVRRALIPAHEELIAARYLREVVIEGRGMKQILTYHFQSSDAPDPALVATLRDVGFSVGAAQEVSKLYGDRVEQAVQYALERRATGYQIKNMPGFIVDYLKSEDKYSPAPVVEVQPMQPETTTERVRQATQLAEEKAMREAEAAQQFLKALTPQEQYQEAKAALTMLLKKHLSKHEMKRLEEACLSGQILAGELKEQVLLATSRLSLAEFMDSLKKQLQSFGLPVAE
ncbi:replication initiator protein A [Deinococcus roseus]|uniref:Uncharacterized protein n=1 Tax=Deinococcus roseus TaxID=392414 RepID=A0ABQ2DK97_9DEIO|nr:replication initiator protein A [Deinococcus roseus]GGJ58483.1 hypothetical protein GCM10008938_50760 [Deinococcus roseus]